MKDALNLVRGAVSTKDLIPVLTHFHIYDGRIQGANGRVVIDAPCPELAGLNVTVPAERFLKAVDACDGRPSIKVTEKGKLSVSKGKFRALLPLLPNDAYPRSVSLTDDPAHNLTLSNCSDWGIIASLARVREFVGEDASRPWVCTIGVRNSDAYATNNVVLVRTFIKLPIDIDFPVTFVDEVIRIGDQPCNVYASINHVQFSYDNGVWIKGVLVQEKWLPSAFDLIKETDWTDAHSIEGLAEAVEQVRPFVPDEKVPVIKLGAHGVSTQEGDHYACVEGATFPDALFRAEPLATVLAVATHMDLSHYPRPVPWASEELEGVIVGVRQ